jgi:hypothetical protein
MFRLVASRPEGDLSMFEILFASAAQGQLLPLVREFASVRSCNELPAEPLRFLKIAGSE